MSSDECMCVPILDVYLGEFLAHKVRVHVLCLGVCVCVCAQSLSRV